MVLNHGKVSDVLSCPLMLLFGGGFGRSPQETYADNATGVWCVVFAISKIFELADTVFVVLRKKPLIFLHW